MTHSLHLTDDQVQDLRGILASAEQDRTSVRRRALGDENITHETAMNHARQQATTKLIIEQLDLAAAEADDAVSNLRRTAGAMRLVVSLGAAPAGVDWLSMAVECDALARHVHVHVDVENSAGAEV